jgi:hypothetical protein
MPTANSPTRCRASGEGSAQAIVLKITRIKKLLPFWETLEIALKILTLLRFY